MIVWITGNSGVGKTTLAGALSLRRKFVTLDGDRMRETISRDAGFSEEDRHDHNIRVALLAGEIERQGFDVVVSVIAPFGKARAEIDKLICPIWIYLHRHTIKATEERPYEQPENALLVLDTEKLSVMECLEIAAEALGWTPSRRRP